jgi:hypothetical protein
MSISPAGSDHIRVVTLNVGGTNAAHSAVIPVRSPVCTGRMAGGYPVATDGLISGQMQQPAATHASVFISLAKHVGQRPWLKTASECSLR